ncbi:MAG: class I SAM-dependent methyltransferase [Bacteroidia bacterium]
MEINCPLCLSSNSANPIKGADDRVYYKCENCFLIFVDKQFLPLPENELKRYNQHQNSIDDKEYVDFLNQAIHPALKYIQPNFIGLDYGCGKNAVLSQLLSKYGITCQNYDVYFSPKWPENSFDFIFCTETTEHFFFPEREFLKMIAHLKKGGLLIIMTELWTSIDDFKNWYYTRDFTHVCFYHQNTINYLAQKFNLTMLFNDAKRVVIFSKN